MALVQGNHDKNREKGSLGERIAAQFLIKKQFVLVKLNYRKQWGEIDIIAVKDNVVHFFEVKSVTGIGNTHRPEENVHAFKVKQIRRMVKTYFAENGMHEQEFQFHVLSVYLNETSRKARVHWIENLVL